MFNVEKSRQFQDLVYGQYLSRPVKIVEMDVAVIHKWLMDNLQARESITGIVGGTPTTMAVCVNSGEKSMSFGFRRFANFVFGVAETPDEIFEFLPGTVLVYERLPMRLCRRTEYDLLPLPHLLDIFYPQSVYKTLYLQYLDVGWVQVPKMPGRYTDQENARAINGALIRQTFNVFFKLLKNAGGCVLREVTLAVQRDITNHPKEYWNALISSVTTCKKDWQYLNEYRDDFKAYDPSTDEFIVFWKAVKAMDSLDLSASDLKTRFESEIRQALLALLEKKKKK